MNTSELNVSPRSVYYRGNFRDNMANSLVMVDCLGHYIYEKGYNLKRESFNSFLILYIKKGNMNINFHNNNITLHEGESIVLNCYEAHSYGTSTGAEALWLHIAGIPVHNTLLNICNDNNGIIPSSCSLRILTLCEYLLSYFSNDMNTICDFTVSKMLYNCIMDICKDINITTDQTSNLPSTYNINRTINYIRDNYNHDITIKELADMASFSQYHFIRVFKKATGYTPHEYIINERLWHACFLLKNSSMSLKDIAYATGFSDESSFHNTFKRAKNCTPGQYRNGVQF